MDTSIRVSVPLLIYVYTCSYEAEGDSPHSRLERRSELVAPSVIGVWALSIDDDRGPWSMSDIHMNVSASVCLSTKYSRQASSCDGGRVIQWRGSEVYSLLAVPMRSLYHVHMASPPT